MGHLSEITGSIEKEEGGGRRGRSNRGRRGRQATPSTAQVSRPDDLFRHATLLPFYMALETTTGQWPLGPAEESEEMKCNTDMDESAAWAGLCFISPLCCNIN